MCGQSVNTLTVRRGRQDGPDFDDAQRTLRAALERVTRDETQKARVRIDMGAMAVLFRFFFSNVLFS